MSIDKGGMWGCMYSKNGIVSGNQTVIDSQQGAIHVWYNILQAFRDQDAHLPHLCPTLCKISCNMYRICSTTDLELATKDPLNDIAFQSCLLVRVAFLGLVSRVLCLGQAHTH